jgi:methyltransferase-like protein
MMKLKNGFITHTIGDEQMMVAAGSASRYFHGMVQSNSTAAFIVDCLKQPTTEEAIVDAVLGHYTGVDRAVATKDVREILEKLRSIHALDEA